MPLKEKQINQLPPVLHIVKNSIYDPLSYEINKLEIEIESKEYEACNFELNGLKIIHRLSKITPTKTGQFVTIWKRNEAGITAPFDVKDDFDLLSIAARTDNRIGLFIFTKTILVQHKVITKNAVGGKRGIRIYPSWDMVGNKQAEKTQEWQRPYFLEIDFNGNTDLALAKKLISV